MAERLSFTLTDEETSGKASYFPPIPAGWYDVEIEDISDRVTGPDSKKPGTPGYGFKFRLLDGQETEEGKSLDNKRLFTNAWLAAGQLFTIHDIAVAVGLHEKGNKEFTVPEKDELIGRELKVRVIVKDKYFKKGVAPLDTEGNVFAGKAGQEKQKDNEVKGFKSINESVSASSPAPAKKGAKGFSL